MKMWKFHSSGMQMIYAQYQLGNKKLIAFLKVHKRLILTSFLMGVIWIAIESSTSSWLTYTIPIYIFSTTPILILWRYVESDLKNLHSLIRFGNNLYSRISIFCSQIRISTSTFFLNNQGIVSFPWLFIKRAILFENFLCPIDAGIFLYHQTDITKPLLNIGPLFAPNYDVPELRNEKVVAFQTLFNRSFFYRSCVQIIIIIILMFIKQEGLLSSPFKFFP